MSLRSEVEQMIFKLVIGVVASLVLLIIVLGALNIVINPSIEDPIPNEYLIVDIETYYVSGFLYTSKQVKITYIDNNITKYVVTHPGSITYFDTHNESKLKITDGNQLPQYEVYIKV